MNHVKQIQDEIPVQEQQSYCSHLELNYSGDDQLETGPEEAAHPDDQGPFSTCTRHSLSKATVDGYEDGIFTSRKLK